MPSFWFIWLLFVPVGIFCFDRTFESIYGDNYIPQLIIQFLGLQNFAGFYGINPTWWFMSCIIGLYLLYPYLLKIHDRGYGLLLLGGSFIITFISIPYTGGALGYMFPFIVGMYYAKGVTMPPHSQNMCILGCIIILTTLLRLLSPNPYWFALDRFLAFEIVLLFTAIKSKISLIMTILTFIGSHSMNIFMFHTFIYYYYFEDFIYYTRNPLLIFLTLLVVCLILSMGIEYLKKKLHFAQCQQKIINKLI